MTTADVEGYLDGRPISFRYVQGDSGKWHCEIFVNHKREWVGELLFDTEEDCRSDTLPKIPSILSVMGASSFERVVN